MFRVTTFGESHGGGVGCVIDGVPPRMKLTQEEIQFELDRRRPGQSRITTPRNEFDTCEVLSGLVNDYTTGTPIAVLVRNKDQRSKDYTEMSVAYRPSHADATYDFKYGIRAIAGGGRSSARETIGRVAAGAVAKKILKLVAGCEVLAYVSQVKDVKAENVDHATFTMEQVEANIVRCPDESTADAMIAQIDEVRNKGDSCGGVVTCVVRNCPKGLGAPVFHKLEADLAYALMSIPATKGFTIGTGFEGVSMLGSTHNDEFYTEEDGNIRTRTNRSGGIQGGISNGENIEMAVAFKPTSTISRKQNTDAEPRGEGHSGHETHEKHLRDIKASRYGPNYACNQEATQDWESFELRPTAELQSTADVQNVGGALAFSHSSDATLAYAVYTMPPFAEQPMAVVCSGTVTNEEDMRALYGLPEHPPGTQTSAELIRDLYCQDFTDQYGDMSDQPATALAALKGDWSFVLYDTASSYLLVAQAANPKHPLHWGSALMDGALLFSTEPEMLPWMCSCESGRPSPFPPACYYENDGFLNPAYEHGNIFSFYRLKGHRLVKPLPKVDSRQNVCGISFRTESNKDIAAMDKPGNVIC